MRWKCDVIILKLSIDEMVPLPKSQKHKKEGGRDGKRSLEWMEQYCIVCYYHYNSENNDKSNK